ncbi:hypothetical protein DFH07DRAFT_1065767 [Mycena maculata]|uniref:Uncharacterized protein n=1 Tax=Mycena maculata TaxID=230809 RepID=A0AAD7I0B5_9AGAR|nr:hypothetical protein DFH07DRAFT_1065767 [Mycena maculata]
MELEQVEAAGEACRSQPPTPASPRRDAPRQHRHTQSLGLLSPIPSRGSLREDARADELAASESESACSTTPSSTTPAPSTPRRTRPRTSLPPLPALLLSLSSLGALFPMSRPSSPTAAPTSTATAGHGIERPHTPSRSEQLLRDALRRGSSASAPYAASTPGPVRPQSPAAAYGGDAEGGSALHPSPIALTLSRLEGRVAPHREERDPEHEALRARLERVLAASSSPSSGGGSRRASRSQEQQQQEQQGQEEQVFTASPRSSLGSGSGSASASSESREREREQQQQQQEQQQTRSATPQDRSATPRPRPRTPTPRRRAGTGTGDESTQSPHASPRRASFALRLEGERRWEAFRRNAWNARLRRRLPLPSGGDGGWGRRRDAFRRNGGGKRSEGTLSAPQAASSFGRRRLSLPSGVGDGGWGRRWEAFRRNACLRRRLPLPSGAAGFLFLRAPQALDGASPPRVRERRQAHLLGEAAEDNALLTIRARARRVLALRGRIPALRLDGGR